MAAHSAEKKGTFLEEVIESTPGGERLVHCLQCGSCGGSCPSGADMEYTPRTLIAMINAGDRDAVLAANTMWACVSCYLCTSRCPQSIPITDIIYCLKRMSIAERRYRIPTPGAGPHVYRLRQPVWAELRVRFGHRLSLAEPAAEHDEDGADGPGHVHPRPDGDHAHQDPPDRPASGDYQESERVERGREVKQPMQIENCKLTISNLQFAVCNFPSGVVS